MVWYAAANISRNVVVTSNLSAMLVAKKQIGGVRKIENVAALFVLCILALSMSIEIQVFYKVNNRLCHHFAHLYRP